MTTTVLKPAGPRPKPPAAGIGRTKGVPNKITRQLKDMILGALEEAGGQQYLAEQAKANPTAFMTLVGKVLPLQLGVGDGGGIVIEIVKFGYGDSEP